MASIPKGSAPPSSGCCPANAAPRKSENIRLRPRGTADSSPRMPPAATPTIYRARQLAASRRAATVPHPSRWGIRRRKLEGRPWLQGLVKRASIIGRGRSSRFKGSKMRPSASRETVPSRTLSSFWPKMTGEAPSWPSRRNRTCPMRRVTVVPSAKIKRRVVRGLMPTRRKTGAGTTEYTAPESTRNFSRAVLRGWAGFAVVAVKQPRRAQRQQAGAGPHSPGPRLVVVIPSPLTVIVSAAKDPRSSEAAEVKSRGLRYPAPRRSLFWNVPLMVRLPGRRGPAAQPGMAERCAANSSETKERIEVKCAPHS
jgi:hypothetical protein